jgi:hypothetical protein
MWMPCGHTNMPPPKLLISLLINTTESFAKPKTDNWDHRTRSRDSPSSRDATVGAVSRLRICYFDSRCVFRVYNVSIDETEWPLWRDADDREH